MVVFYDSDDLWFFYYLEICVKVLDEFFDVDWVFGGLRCIDVDSGEVFEELNFVVLGIVVRICDLGFERCGEVFLF